MWHGRNVRSCVRRYHVYHTDAIWIPVKSWCIREPCNAADRYAVRFLTSHNVVLDGMEPDSEPFGSGRPSIGYQRLR